MGEGLDEAREAFAQEIPQATRQRDQGGRFVSTNKPEAIFQPREVEGDPLTGDTRDGGADPRFEEQERRIADGRSEEGEPVQKPAKRVPAASNDNDEPAEPQPPERIGQEADDADQDGEKPDKGDGSEPEPGEDASPRYKIQIDGEEHEVSLNEALRGYQREETFNQRMQKMVEIAKTVDERGSQAQQARDAYIQLCQRQEEEFGALIPKEPDWNQLYKDNPAAAHQLENNFKAVYGTLNAIRQRRAAAAQEAFNDNAQRTASYARAEFDKFKSKNKLNSQGEVDKAIGWMRRTAMAHGFSEDEIGTTYDERMLSILHKAAKYDNIIAQRPVPVQPERNGALQPGTAPRIGDSRARTMNDAQKRLASSGKVDDAALVMAQFLRR
jgi:hypothetical protein